MKRFFRLALLIGAFFGLVGQSAAIAMSPHCAAAMMQSAKPVQRETMGKMDCCPDAATGKHDSKPSKGGMPGCPMMAGCFVSLALSEAVAVPVVTPIKPAPFLWSLASQLSGRSTAPEAPPPTL